MAEQGTGLGDALDGLRRRWPVALLVAIPMFAGVVAYAESLPDLYDGEAVVAFAPRPEAEVSADTIRLIVPKYVAYLSSVATARSVAAELERDPDDLRRAIDASVATDTANLTVKVRLRDPQVAADAADRLAREAVVLSTIDEQLTGRVIAPAVPATEPSSPPRRLIEAGGLLLALLAGALAAVLAFRHRPRIGDPMALAMVTGHGVLGRVPKSRALRGPLAGWLTDPAVGTAVRALRTQVEHSGGAPTKVLAITSAMPAEGKTTVAAALAAAYGRIDAKVLLLDADMRQPKLADRLGLAADARGLAEVLEGKATLKAVAQPAGVPGVSAVTTTARADAGDLVARKFQAVLQDARSQYDVVVVDCPPLLATDDARTLALLCDGTILVTARGTESSRVAEASEGLDSLKVRVLGCVLNRSRMSRREGMGSYGAYG